jgi:hypothetical protein
MAGLSTAAIVGGSVLGGSIVAGAAVQDRAAKKAAKAQEKAAHAGISEQRAAREEFRETAAPFLELGEVGAEQLTNFLNDPNAGLDEIAPITDFLRAEGFEQIQETAAARGQLGSGSTLKDLTRFSENLASTVAPQLRNQRFQELFGVARLGANVAAGQGTAAQTTANNIGQLEGGIGQAKAQGAFNRSNAITGALESVSAGVGALGGVGAFSRPAGGASAGGAPQVNLGNLDFSRGIQSGTPLF